METERNWERNLVQFLPIFSFIQMLPSILQHYSPENLRKYIIFRRFQGVKKMLQKTGKTWNKWANEFYYPAYIIMFKVNIRSTRTRCEICSNLTVKTPGRCLLRRSGVFIINFEHISQLVLIFILLTLSK